VTRRDPSLQLPRGALGRGRAPRRRGGKAQVLGDAPRPEGTGARTRAAGEGEHVRRRPGRRRRTWDPGRPGPALPAQLPQGGDHGRQLQAMLAHAEAALHSFTTQTRAPAVSTATLVGRRGARRDLAGPKTPPGSRRRPRSPGPTSFPRRTRGRPGGRKGRGKPAGPGRAHIYSTGKEVDQEGAQGECGTTSEMRCER
uniref:Uncharacterized protein n=1 Tax=Equus asinus asinus TaxID=83772 RepID=A0A8C4KWM8_EQUAS